LSKRLTTLHILKGGTFSKDFGATAHENFHAIRAFCAEYPHVTVRSRLSTLTLSTPDLVPGILRFTYVARGQLSLAHRVVTLPKLFNLLVYEYDDVIMREPVATARYLPENFRMCFSDVWDERVLRESTTKSTLDLILVNYGVERGMDAYVKVMREIYDEGI
jgi:hypothetical protein